MSIDGYHTWYDIVTRRYMINPTLWASKKGFLGPQGLLPVAAEGLSNAYHKIQGSDVVADDPIVDSALQGMEVILDDTSFQVLQARRPHPPPMVPNGHRRPRTRGGSTSVAFPHPRPAPLDGYVPWGQTMARDGSAGHGAWTVTQDFHGTHPSTFQHSQIGEGFWGRTYGSGSSFQTPESGFQPFMSHDTSGSRYASPVVHEDDDDDEGPGDDLLHRWQVPSMIVFSVVITVAPLS
ncbi:hypothetical protein AgCh_031166 [Apium graveolens]